MIRILRQNFNKPDLLTTIENEHIEVKKSGNRYVTLSPFRNERHPSFFIYPDTQRWYDFGMGRGGDVIDFISLYKGLSFKDALKCLGISTDRPTPEAIKKIEYKREIVKRFKQWCNNYHNDLCRLFRTLQKAKSKAKTIEEVEALTNFYHRESKWLNRIQILIDGTDQDKFLLYCQVIGGSS